LISASSPEQSGFLAGLNILYPTAQHHTMTALHIRKNIAAALVNTAAAVENANVNGIKEKLNEYRIRTAALIMPSNMAFVITPKENIK